MSRFDGKAFGQEIVAEVRGFVEREAKVLVERLDALERRLAEVEAGGIKYFGVWQAAGAYKRGALVTHRGSVWHANTDAAPGDEPGAAVKDGATARTWTLAVKAGRDGKDATR